MSVATEAKADRLVAAGAVEEIDGLQRAYIVQGDKGRHRVVVGRFMAWCSPADGQQQYPSCRNGACSHVTAAVRVFERDHGPRETT